MRGELLGHPAYLTIISTGRPDNVARMTEVLGIYPTWVVRESDVRAYRDAGAGRVVAAPPGVAAARNVALKRAFAEDVPCITLSDDFKRVKADQPGAKPVETSLASALGQLLDHTLASGYKLGGASPTDNAYFVRHQHQHQHFIVGDATVVLPCALRYDERLQLKEDYDFTLQHIEAYGGVNRCDHLLFTWKHYSNKGGAVATRTQEVEQAAIAHLMRKWPGQVRPNPKRENEVLLVKRSRA